MATNNKLKYYITADHTPFEKGMAKAVSAAKTGGKVLGAGLAAGAVLGTAALVGMTKVMSEAVELAGIQEEAEAKLAAVLKTTGEAAGYNLDQLKAMAGGMQQVTTVGDETILSGMAVLATFKEIRGEGFEKATMAALDMSAVLGTDLNSSLVQIGKALNDPIAGMSALTRSGVAFTDQQKDQVKALQESGDIMGAQAIILNELEGEFGGVAASLRGTFTGAVDSAKNAFGDLQEEIGFSITKNETFIDLAEEAEQTFIDWAQAIKDNEEAIGSFATATITNIKAVAEATGAAFLAVQQWGKELEAVGNKRTILQLREELGGLNEDLYRAKEGWFGFGKASEEEIARAERGVANLKELISELENGEIKGVGLSKAVIKDLEKIEEAKEKALISSTENQKKATKTAEVEAKNRTSVEKKELDERLKEEEDYWDDSFDVAAKTIDDREDLQKDLTKEIKKLTLSDLKYKEWAFEQEHQAAVKLAGDDKALVADLSQYKKLKLKEIAEENEKTADEMSYTWGDFSDDVGGEFGDFGSNLIDGEFKSIGDAWDSLWSSMLGTVASAVMEVVGMRAATAIVDGITDAFFHTGEYQVKDTEENAVVLKDEMIVPPDASRTIRENLASVGTGNNSFDTLIRASEQYNEEYIPNEARDGGYSGSGGMLGDFDFGAASKKGIASAITRLGMGAYYGVDFDPSAIASGFSTAGLKETVAAAGRGVDRAFGVDPGTYSGFGHKVGGLLGGILGGPLGYMAGTALGGVFGDGVGDLFDDRDYEGVLDALEDGVISPEEASRFKAEADRMGVDSTGFLGGVAEAIAALKATISEALGFSGGWDDYGGLYGSGTGSEVGGWGGGSSSDADANSDAGYGVGVGTGGTEDDGNDWSTGGVPTKVYGNGFGSDDGFVSFKLGEGIVSPRGMKNLESINNGSFGSDDLKPYLLAIAQNTAKTKKYLDQIIRAGIPVTVTT